MKKWLSRFWRDGTVRHGFFAANHANSREGFSKFVQIRETCPEPVEGSVAEILVLQLITVEPKKFNIQKHCHYLSLCNNKKSYCMQRVIHPWISMME